jgi:hypothetical protein
MPDHRILVVIPGLPEQRSGGGAMLYELLACGIDRPKVRRVCRQALATAARVGAVSPADVPPLNRLDGRAGNRTHHDEPRLSAQRDEP